MIDSVGISALAPNRVCPAFHKLPLVFRLPLLSGNPDRQHICALNVQNRSQRAGLPRGPHAPFSTRSAAGRGLPLPAVCGSSLAEL